VENGSNTDARVRVYTPTPRCSGGWAPVAPVILGQSIDLSIDDAGLQSVFVVQDGLRRGNRIPAANQDLPIEAHFSGREDHQNSEKCGDEALREIPLSRDI